MNTEKNMSTRIIHKHDIEANWNKATNFIPKQGELIVYDPDENCNYQRIKIGDGITKINELNFAKAPGYVAQPEAPYDTTLLWLDTDDTGNASEFAVSDWNAAEGEPGHILNRTHYSKIETILEETNLSSYEEDGLFDLDCSIFELGKIYTITYNDIQYVCEAIDCGVVDSSLSGTVLLGNYSLLLETGDTGEPFVILGIDNAIIDINGNTTATISVSGEIVNKIPIKFLPEGYPYIKSAEQPIFSGNLNQYEFIQISNNNYYVKISPEIITTSATIIGSELSIQDESALVSYTVTEEMIVNMRNLWDIDGYGIVDDNKLYVLSIASTFSLSEGVGFSPGTWFLYEINNNNGTIEYTKSLSCLTKEVEKIVTLDDKYLSNNIARASDIFNIQNDISNIQNDISDIQNDISNIGNGLPNVNFSNNGAFLRVVNGKWAAVKLPNAEDGEF